MKVLPLQPNDHRSIRRVADEFRIFEGINHPHLVKCYGVEIHNVRILLSSHLAKCHSIQQYCIRNYNLGMLVDTIQLYLNHLWFRVFNSMSRIALICCTHS